MLERLRLAHRMIFRRSPEWPSRYALVIDIMEALKTDLAFLGMRQLRHERSDRPCVVWQR